jgi:hypothetical protein
MRRSYYLTLAISTVAGVAWLFGWLILVALLDNAGVIEVPKQQGRPAGPLVTALALLLIASSIAVIWCVRRIAYRRLGVACPAFGHLHTGLLDMREADRTGRCAKCPHELVAGHA